MMYFLPAFRLTSLEIVEAINCRTYFSSIFLIKTTKFEIRNEQNIYETVKSIYIILVGLLARSSASSNENRI